MHFRSIDDGDFGSVRRRTSPPAPPQTADFGYFTEKAIRVSVEYSSPADIRPDFPRIDRLHHQATDISEAVRREIEKARIREEIIAEEMIRRRLLEEEVRREMMLEREKLMRRGESSSLFGSSSSISALRVDPRLPLLTNFRNQPIEERVTHREMGFPGVETAPFQRIPPVQKETLALEGRKEKTIVLAKPDHAKRNATTPPALPTELPLTALKKLKSKDNWTCAQCGISATSEQGLKDHFRGRKHKAKEQGSIPYRTGFGTSPSTQIPRVNVTPSSEGGNSEKQSEKNSDKVSTQETTNRTKLKFWCEMCNVGAQSLKVLNAHKRGKKHMTKLLKLVENREANLTLTSTNKAPQPVKEANLLAEETEEVIEEETLVRKEETGSKDRVDEGNVDAEVKGGHREW